MSHDDPLLRGGAIVGGSAAYGCAIKARRADARRLRGHTCSMEEWLSRGRLSDEEFDQLVRLTARYVLHDVDQFDHWWMPNPQGLLSVDFSWWAGPDDGSSDHRLMWPPAAAGDPTAWVLSERTEMEGAWREVARYARRAVAEAFLNRLQSRWPARSYRLIPPEAPDG